jgi:hypothetical protein
MPGAHRGRGVSNPHRYGQKLERWAREVDLKTLFQTLIGTVKRPLPHRHPGQHHHVSNPHRYGQKREVVNTLDDALGEFQTLIGTVKSGLSFWKWQGRCSFKPS